MRDFAGRRLDYWVSGWGTGGTLTGAGEVIKAGASRREDHRHRARGRVALLGGKEWQPHKIQGWTPDFLPSVLNKRGLRRADAGYRRRGVEGDVALRLAREEGIFVGLSSGATTAAGLRIAENAEKGSVILVMLPDTGERYLSSFLFEEIETGNGRRVARGANAQRSRKLLVRTAAVSRLISTKERDAVQHKRRHPSGTPIDSIE